MTADTITRPGSIRAELERSRLEHRARRIERVLIVLRERRARTVGTVDALRGLDQAIAGFGQELGAVRARLRALC